MSCFFLPNILFQNTFTGEVIFLLSQNHELDEAEKIAYLSSISHFFLSSMHEVIGESILSNIFLKKQFTFT